MKKLIMAAAIAASTLGLGLSTMTSAGATAYPGSGWSTPVQAAVPVNCAFAMPSVSIGNVVFIGNTDFTDQFAMPSIGTCNVAFTPTWTLGNNSNSTADGKGRINGQLKGKDSGGNTHQFNYYAIPPFTGAQAANQVVGGTFDIDVPTGQSDIYGGVNYTDVVTLTVNYV